MGAIDRIIPPEKQAQYWKSRYDAEAELRAIERDAAKEEASRLKAQNVALETNLDTALAVMNGQTEKIDMLRAALKPFANAADLIDGPGTETGIVCGDLRNARAALGGEPAPPSPEASHD